LVTRYVLPALTPQQLALRDLSRMATTLDHGIGRAAALRWPAAVLALAACGAIALHHGSIWNRSLSGLNPVPSAEQQADAQLRADLGGTDTRYIMALTAPDQEAALQQAERAGAVLQDLVRKKTIAGFNS